MPLPIYLALPPGPARDAVLAALGDGVDPLPFHPRVSELDGTPPGVVLLDAESVTLAELSAVAGALDASGSGWTFAFVEGSPPRIRSVSLGLPHAPRDVSERARAPDERPDVLLELHRVLIEVARSRHDVNNPLTAALAEIQLLLMEERDDETHGSLEVVQEQLRRIRDLVAATGHIRPPRS